jgi:hypothetical protein
MIALAVEFLPPWRYPPLCPNTLNALRSQPRGPHSHLSGIPRAHWHRSLYYSSTSSGWKYYCNGTSPFTPRLSKQTDGLVGSKRVLATPMPGVIVTLTLQAESKAHPLLKRMIGTFPEELPSK